MATTPAKKAGSGDAEIPAAKTATRTGPKPADVRRPGPGKARMAKAGAEGNATSGPLVEKAHIEVKLRDLIDKVTATTGVNKQQVRAVVEAMLKEMGDALTAARVLNLPGFGKARVAKMAETPTGVMTIKLRQGQGGGAGGGGKSKAGAEPLAETGEDS